MRLRLLIGISILTALFNISSCQKNPKKEIEDIFSKVEDTYFNKISISYDLEFIYKYPDIEHLTTVNANVNGISVDNDANLGGKLFIEREDDRKLIYDASCTYYVRPTEDYITTYSTTENLKTACDGLLITYTKGGFFKTDWAERLQDTSHTFEILANNEKKIIIKETYEADESEIEREYYFDKVLNLFTKITEEEYIEESHVYHEWNFKNIIFDSYSEVEFNKSLSDLITNTKLKEYQEVTEDDLELITVGEQAPMFSGINYLTNEEFVLANLDAKVVLLDFWFIDCPYCVKIMPTLHDLYDQYKDEGFVILGLNRRDNTKRGLKRMPGFIEKMKPNYPIILTDSSQKPDSLYNIKYYPSFYVLDKDKKVAFASIGWDESIPKVIKDLLHK